MSRSSVRRLGGLILGFGLAATAFGVATSGGHGPAVVRPPLNAESDVQRGLQIAPVPLDPMGHNRALVGRGSYLVNAVASCADCHSCPTYEPSHNPYMGGDGKFDSEHYLAGGVPFGPFVSANLTPDDTGRPAGLTRAEFVEALRTGHDPDDPSQVLQVMPWPVLRNMTDHDLDAIYEFLGSIPHAESGTECGGPGE